MSESEIIFIDAAFPLRGTEIPLDHGYALFSALSRVLPMIHDRPNWALHPIDGIPTGSNTLALQSNSCARIRLSISDFRDVLPLAGKSIELAGVKLMLGVPRVFSLRAVASVCARFVTVKKFADDPAPFCAALRRQIARIDRLGQDPERIEVAVGRRRVMRVSAQQIVGFAVVLEGLEPGASLAIQRHGLGGRRHMGAGVFVPTTRAEQS